MSVDSMLGMNSTILENLNWCATCLLCFHSFTQTQINNGSMIVFHVFVFLFLFFAGGYFA